MGEVADSQCGFVRSAHWLPMANASHQSTPWQTVYGYFRRWKKNGLWERINEALVKKVRVKHGRKAEPNAGILDSQSVKTSEGGENATL